MKTFIKFHLQNLLGFDKYLFIFSVFKIIAINVARSEKQFLQFINLLPNDGILLDIGANIGITSVAAARLRPNIDIFSIEPMPDNIRALRKVVAFFRIKSIKIYQVALGDKNGVVKMVMPTHENVRCQGLSHVIKDQSVQHESGNVFDVQIQQLDDFDPVQNVTKKIVALKIDVENYEYFVIKGGLQIIQKHRPLLYIELWDNENRVLCMNQMLGIQYTAYFFRDSKLIKFDQNQNSGINFCFLPNEIKIH